MAACHDTDLKQKWSERHYQNHEHILLERGGSSCRTIQLPSRIGRQGARARSDPAHPPRKPPGVKYRLSAVCWCQSAVDTTMDAQ